MSSTDASTGTRAAPAAAGTIDMKLADFDLGNGIRVVQEVTTRFPGRAWED